MVGFPDLDLPPWTTTESGLIVPGAGFINDREMDHWINTLSRWGDQSQEYVDNVFTGVETIDELSVENLIVNPSQTTADPRFLLGGRNAYVLVDANLVSCNATLACTTTPTLVPGCSISFTMKKFSVAMFWVAADSTVSGGTPGLDFAVTQVYVDGAANMGPQLSVLTAGTVRATTAQTYFYLAGSDGAHTFDLMGYRLGAGGTVQITATHTTFAVLHFTSR